MKLIQTGVAVSPAPFIELIITCPMAYTRNPKLMMRRQVIPLAITTGSSIPFMKKEMNFSGIAMKRMDTSPRKIILAIPTTQADRSARSGCFAPRFCPTRVAAAFASPQEGSSANKRTLMAMV